MRFLFVLPVVFLVLFFVWFTVVTISGFGDMVGWWEYAEVCTPKDALAFCWTGDKHS